MSYFLFDLVPSDSGALIDDLDSRCLRELAVTVSVRSDGTNDCRDFIHHKVLDDVDVTVPPQKKEHTRTREARQAAPNINF